MTAAAIHIHKRRTHGDGYMTAPAMHIHKKDTWGEEISHSATFVEVNHAVRVGHATFR